MDEIGVFTLQKSDESDDEPSTKWERRRATVNGTNFPEWRIGHSFSTADDGVYMFGYGDIYSLILIHRNNRH